MSYQQTEPKNIQKYDKYAIDFFKFNPEFTVIENNCATFSFEKACDLIDCFVIYSPNNQLLSECTIRPDPKSIYRSNEPVVNYPIELSQYPGMYYVKFGKNILNLLCKYGNEVTLQFKNTSQNQDDICIYYNAIYVERDLRRIIYDSHSLLFPFEISYGADNANNVWDIDKYDYGSFMEMHKDDPTLCVNTFRWNKDYCMIKCMINCTIRLTIENKCDFDALELLMNERNVFHPGNINLMSDMLKDITFEFK